MTVDPKKVFKVSELDVLKEMTPFEKNDGLNEENATEFENFLQEHLGK